MAPCDSGCGKTNAGPPELQPRPSPKASSALEKPFFLNDIGTGAKRELKIDNWQFQIANCRKKIESNLKLEIVNYQFSIPLNRRLRSPLNQAAKRLARAAAAPGVRSALHPAAYGY